MSLLKALHRQLLGKYRLQALAGKIAAIVPAGATVLDVGCGNGRLAAEVMARRPDIRIVGVDIVTVDQGEIPINYYDGITIPYADKSWDLCMANDVLHHCARPMETLREMRRVARSHIIIKDHLADGRFDFEILRLMDWLGNVGYGTPLPYNFWSTTAWRSVFLDLHLSPTLFIERLNLYPPLFLGLLDRRMHFLALLEVQNE